MKFPDKLFIRMEPDDDDQIFLAYRNQSGAVDRDGPTMVAEYKLVHVERLAKKVVNVFDREK